MEWRYANLTCFVLSIGHFFLLISDGAVSLGNNNTDYSKNPIPKRTTPSKHKEKLSSATQQKFVNVTLQAGEVQIITINADRVTRLTISNASRIFKPQKTKDIAFWIFEVHTDTLKVSMTLKPDEFPSGDTMSGGHDQTLGSNVGMIVLNNHTNSSEAATVYLHNNNNCNVKGIVLVRGYTQEEPVPALGNLNHGKNHTINGLKPDLNITWDNYVTTLRFRQAGSLKMYNEDKLKGSTLVYKYSIYQFWFKEGVFNSDHYIKDLSSLLLRKDIESNGYLVKDYYQKRNVTGSGMVEVRFPTFPGTAQLYAVIVSTSKETPPTNWIDKKGNSVHVRKEESFYSAYVGTVSAGCYLKIEMPLNSNPEEEQQQSRTYSVGHNDWPTITGCSSYYYSETNVMVAFSLVMGVFVLFLGHQFFSIAQFIYGIMIVALLVYPLFTTYLHLNHMWILIISVVAGIGGGIVTSYIWLFLGKPMLSTVFPSVLGGGILGFVVLHICGCLQAEFLMETGFFYGILVTVGLAYVGITIHFTR